MPHCRPVYLNEIWAADQAIIIGLNSDQVDEATLLRTRPELCQPKHQIGGQPYWVTGKARTDLQCIKCGTMPFFANIADDATGDLKFTGNPFVQTLFFLCRSCRVVAVYQQCD